jgi:hypothetical protein
LSDCEILIEEGELALCLQGQRVSVKLVALPALRQAGHRYHIVIGLDTILIGLFQVSTQRVDARAQRDKKSGFPDSFARITPFEIAPFLLRC